MPDHSLPPSPETLPDEVPVAIVCNGTAQAVMMATPRDLEDFGWGFARSEGFLSDLRDVEQAEIVSHPGGGFEARFWLSPDRTRALAQRTRRMLGPAGCGLCGLDSIEAALRPVARIPETGFAVAGDRIGRVTDDLAAGQSRESRGMHAAGFYRPGDGLVLVREDVGRHNALDKVCGALLRQGIAADDGALVLTSRVSVDLVQKAAIAGVPMLIAVSTPTRLAVETATAAGLTLVAQSRGGGYRVFSHARRIT